MTKADATRVIVQCAAAYRDNLENTNMLIAYVQKDKRDVEFIEAVFLPRHFMHLTGVKFSDGRKLFSVEFYRKCLNNRLSEDDFQMAADGTTVQKLQVLPKLMTKNLSAKMIGDYKDTVVFLHTEKVTGSVSACMGFVYEKEIGYYSPNTVLQIDIREATRNNYACVVSIFQKKTSDSQYSTPVYVAKGIDCTDILALYNKVPC